MHNYFGENGPIAFEGEASSLAFRWYDPDRIVLGKRMEEQLRIAVCFWHSFCWDGDDGFGGATFNRPWLSGPQDLDAAGRKLDAAFSFLRLLGAPYFTFHDRDVAPQGETMRDYADNLARVTDLMAAHMERTGTQLLWGTSNVTAHPRFMSGVATNPDPEVFAWAAAQIKLSMEATQRLGGANYVLWAGREGYETLLNTDMARESEQLGRFLAMIAEHKHAIGFTGELLIEPKPREPLKHMYDFDAAHILAYLRKYGLEDEYKLNIEANHANLAGHSFEHEITYAIANDAFGSLDMNSGDAFMGWDTDFFPQSPQDVARALYPIMKNGGFSTGGLNLDARIRRQSIAPEDLVAAHVGAMDVCARALLMVEAMLGDGHFEAELATRYAPWDGELGQHILAGEMTLTDCEVWARQAGAGPQPASGRQEQLENMLNAYL